MFQSIADLTKRYSPSLGELPAVLRKYSDQNLLQPYVETHVRDPRLWTMLGIASDHRDFLDFITAYATANPPTKAATELLFMLDEMAQGSRDSLLALLDIDPHSELWWTRHENEDAYGMVMVLQTYYRNRLERRGIRSHEATELYYDKRASDDSHGHCRVDSRRLSRQRWGFLIGSIYWRTGRREEALRSWRELAPQPADRYAEPAAAIGAIMAGADGQTVDRAGIKRVLDAERRRWTSFWRERLRKFGYTFETF